LATNLIREFVAKSDEVDLAQVHREPFGLVLPRRRSADRFIHDPVQFLEEFCNVGGVAPVLKLLINGLHIVVGFNIAECARLHQQRFETDEDLSRENLKATLRLVRSVQSVNSITQTFYARKACRTAQTRSVKS